LWETELCLPILLSKYYDQRLFFFLFYLKYININIDLDYKEQNEICKKNNKDSFTKNKLFNEIQKEIFKNKKAAPSNMENFNEINNKTLEFPTITQKKYENHKGNEIEQMNYQKNVYNENKHQMNISFENKLTNKIISENKEENSKNSPQKNEKKQKKQICIPIIADKNEKILPSMKSYLEKSSVDPELKTSNVLKYLPEVRNISAIMRNNAEKSSKKQQKSILESGKFKPQSEIFDFKTQKELDELMAFNLFQQELELNSQLDEETAKKMNYEQEEKLNKNLIENLQQQNDLENQMVLDEYLAQEYIGFFNLVF